MGGIWCTMVLPVVFMLLRSRKLIAAQTSSIFQHFRYLFVKSETYACLLRPRNV